MALGIKLRDSEQLMVDQQMSGAAVCPSVPKPGSNAFIIILPLICKLCHPFDLNAAAASETAEWVLCCLVLFGLQTESCSGTVCKPVLNNCLSHLFGRLLLHPASDIIEMQSLIPVCIHFLPLHSTIADIGHNRRWCR